MLSNNICAAIAVAAILAAACTPSESPNTPANSAAPTAVDPASPVGSLMPADPPAPAQSPPGTWHGERTGVEFFPLGENIAYDKPAPTIHPRLTEHSQKMVPGVYKVADNVYLAYGYALTSPAMIVGDDGIIIVDPTEDVTTSKVALAAFRKFTDKPVKAVVYSHWHIDHYAGVGAFTTAEAVASGEVKIIAHRDFMDNMIKNSTGGTGPIIAARVGYSLGSLLETGPEGTINGGLGPQFIIKDPTLFEPNVPAAAGLRNLFNGQETSRL